MHPTDYLVHLSNLLMLVAYSVTDILWLRWFAVAAALTNIPYFLVQPTKLWPPVMWALVFTIINLYQIVRIYLERRPVTLSDDEQTLYDLAFRSLRPREFVSLVLLGEWKTAAAGDKVLTEDQAVSSICVAISGTVRVHREGRDVGVIGPGHLIGTGLALTGDPSPVEATFTRTARYMSWPLPRLPARHPSVTSAPPRRAPRRRRCRLDPRLQRARVAQRHAQPVEAIAASVAVSVRGPRSGGICGRARGRAAVFVACGPLPPRALTGAIPLFSARRLWDDARDPGLFPFAERGSAMPNKRTVMRSSAGKKLYAVRDAEGRFEDIQTYERAHRADMGKKSKAEKDAAKKGKKGKRKKAARGKAATKGRKKAGRKKAKKA